MIFSKIISLVLRISLLELDVWPRLLGLYPKVEATHNNSCLL
jgi:hypothetical protein